MLETIEAPAIAPNAPAPEAAELEKPKAPTPQEIKEDPSKARLLHMAKQEKMLRKQAQAIKAREDAIKTREQELQGVAQWKQDLVKDPLKVMQDAGITYDQLAQILTNQPSAQDQALRAVTEKLQSVEEGQKSIQQMIKENEQKQYDQALKQISNDVSSIVRSDPDTYEMIDKYKAQDAVVELIKWTFDNEGNLLSIEDAAKEVEEHLTEEAYTLAQSKKIQSRLKPLEPPPPAPAPDPIPGSGPRPIPRAPEKTLSHQSIPAPASKPLSGKDRRERAILAMLGKLG